MLYVDLRLLGKLALALHPDKNGAPGADEAFKSTFLFGIFAELCILTFAGLFSGI